MQAQVGNAKKADCNNIPPNLPKPKLDGDDLKRVECGELLDLTAFVNASGRQLKIDPNYVSPKDPMKRSNRQRVKLGLSPYLENDEKVELHHDKQDFFGKLLEVSVGFHAMMATDPDYHPFTTDPGYASWRNLVAVYNGKCRSLGEIANIIKEKYWMMRDF